MNYSLTQTTKQGNVSSGQIITQSSQQMPVSTQLAYTYNLTQAGLRNPHQFLGKTSNNLLQQATQQSPGLIKEYSYEYDQKSRVKRYTLKEKVNGEIRWLVIGAVNYTNL